MMGNDVTRILARINKLPVTQHFSVVTFPHPEGGVGAEIERIEAHHLGGMEREVLNGTILMGLLDGVMCGSVMLECDPHSCATVEIHARFVRAVQPPHIRARGWIVRRSGALFSAQAEIRDATGTVCVAGSGAFRVLECPQRGAQPMPAPENDVGLSYGSVTPD